MKSVILDVERWKVPIEHGEVSDPAEHGEVSAPAGNCKVLVPAEHGEVSVPNEHFEAPTERGEVSARIMNTWIHSYNKDPLMIPTLTPLEKNINKYRKSVKHQTPQLG